MDDAPLKRCSTCPEGQQWHPATTEFFYPRKGRNDLYSRCKECCKSQKRTYYQKNSEQVRARVQVYRDQNPEKVKESRNTYNSRESVRKHIRAYQKAYQQRPEVREQEHIRKRQPEYLEQQRVRSKVRYNDPVTHEQILARIRSYQRRPEVRERKRIYNKAYHKDYYSRPWIRERKHFQNQAYYQRPAVRERLRELQRKRYDPLRYQKYKDYYKRLAVQEYRRMYYRVRYLDPIVHAKTLAKNANRRARKKTVPGTHTAAQIAEQLKRQHYHCYYAACGFAKFPKVNGKYIYHVEHTFPISRVIGTGIPANDMSYLVLACKSCNDSKGNKFPWEWAAGGRLL